MSIVIKKPILVAGVSLSFMLWLGQSITNNLGDISNITTLGIIFGGGIFAILGKIKKNKSPISSKIKQITIEDFNQKIAKLDNLINTVIKEAKSSDNSKYSTQDYGLFKQNLADITTNSKRQNLNIGILNKKNNSLNLSRSFEQKFADTQVEKIDNQIEKSVNKKLLLDRDLVLFVIQGDLTDSDKNKIKQIKNSQQRILVLFDDCEFSLAEEKKLIWQNINNSLQEIIDKEEEIVQITTQTQKVKVIKYQDNFNYQESEEITPINYEQLINIYQNKIQPQQENLILSTAYRQALDLERQIKEILNQIRKVKSLSVMDKYQLMSATATFANPVASLDLLATAAINTQMIIDLGKIYQQPLSISQAQEVSIALGKLMLQLGIVEISTQAVANVLKTNAFTFVAGGLMQGVSAAYLTRICGLSLIEYYQVTDTSNSNAINLNVIKQKMEFIFQQNRDNNIFNKFVKKTALRVKS